MKFYLVGGKVRIFNVVSLLITLPFPVQVPFPLTIDSTFRAKRQVLCYFVCLFINFKSVFTGKGEWQVKPSLTRSGYLLLLTLKSSKIVDFKISKYIKILVMNSTTMQVCSKVRSHRVQRFVLNEFDLQELNCSSIHFSISISVIK